MLKKISLVLLLLFPVMVYADTASDFKNILANLKTMRATFTQTILENNKVMQKSTGKMALQRPGKFNWETQTPTQQRIVADGRYFWIYDVDLEQVTRKNQQSSIDTPAILLSGSTDSLMQKFNIATVVSQNDNIKIFDLTPKSENSLFRAVRFYFQGNALTEMRLTSNLGQTSTIKFSNVVLNQSIPANTFRFAPPTGVDVMRE